MPFRLLAFHYPAPGQAADLLRRMDAAAEVMRAASGCIEVENWRDEESGAIVATAKFGSREACFAALAEAASKVDIAEDEREERPRDVHYLVEP